MVSASVIVSELELEPVIEPSDNETNSEGVSSVVTELVIAEAALGGAAVISIPEGTEEDLVSELFEVIAVSDAS